MEQQKKKIKISKFLLLEAKKKRDEERRKKRPTKGIYQPPHRNKADQSEQKGILML